MGDGRVGVHGGADFVEAGGGRAELADHHAGGQVGQQGRVAQAEAGGEAAAEGRYEAELFAGPASEFANFVKRFPAEWILPNYQGITPEAVAYFRPLIEGEPKLVMKGGIPATIVPFNKR